MLTQSDVYRLFQWSKDAENNSELIANHLRFNGYGEKTSQLILERIKESDEDARMDFLYSLISEYSGFGEKELELVLSLLA